MFVKRCLAHSRVIWCGLIVDLISVRDSFDLFSAILAQTRATSIFAPVRCKNAPVYRLKPFIVTISCMNELKSSRSYLWTLEIRNQILTSRYNEFLTKNSDLMAWSTSYRQRSWSLSSLSMRSTTFPLAPWSDSRSLARSPSFYEERGEREREEREKMMWGMMMMKMMWWWCVL